MERLFTCRNSLKSLESPIYLLRIYSLSLSATATVPCSFVFVLVHALCVAGKALVLRLSILRRPSNREWRACGQSQHAGKPPPSPHSPATELSGLATSVVDLVAVPRYQFSRGSEDQCEEGKSQEQMHLAAGRGCEAEASGRGGRMVSGCKESEERSKCGDGVKTKR